MPDVFQGLPLTDAEIAGVYCPGDFATLTARSQRVASGADGSIPAASFTLTSATPFETRGVQAGHVVVIESYTGLDKQGNPKKFEASDLLPVVSVSGSTLNLERFGYSSGQGALPANVTETTGAAGLTYYVPSLLAQITAEYAEVCRMLGIASPADLVNPGDLKTITALKVLRRLYAAMSREAGDPWETKAKDYDTQVAAELTGLRVLYSDDTTQSHRPVSAAPLDDPSWRVPTDYRWGLGPRWPWRG